MVLPYIMSTRCRSGKGEERSAYSVAGSVCASMHPIALNTAFKDHEHQVLEWKRVIHNRPQAAQHRGCHIRLHRTKERAGVSLHSSRDGIRDGIH
eukprot:scaffold214959_cov17-Tisochrysis_lutea.AAC.1